MKKQKLIDVEHDRILVILSKLDPCTEAYTVGIKNLKELNETRSKKPAFPVDLDTIIISTTNLLGILLIINHENLNVITTKAFGLIRRV